MECGKVGDDAFALHAAALNQRRVLQTPRAFQLPAGIQNGFARLHQYQVAALRERLPVGGGEDVQRCSAGIQTVFP